MSAEDLARLRARLQNAQARALAAEADLERARHGLDELARVAASFIKAADRGPTQHAVANAFVLALAIVRRKPAELLPAPRQFPGEGPLRAAWRRLRASWGFQ